jgi:hypothetical protein
MRKFLKILFYMNFFPIIILFRVMKGFANIVLWAVIGSSLFGGNNE